MGTKKTIILESSNGFMGINFRAEIGSFKLIQEKYRWRVFFNSDEKGVLVEHCPDFYRRGISWSEGAITVRLVNSEFQWQEVEHARRVLATLRDDCLGSYRALVKVRSGGDVPGSNLAGKVKIMLSDGRTTTKVVPASQVEAINGELWIPRWLAAEKTKGMGSLAGPFCLPEAIEAGLASIEREFEHQIKLLQEIADPWLEKWISEAPARALKNAQEKEQQLAAAARATELAEQVRRIEKEKQQAKKEKNLKRLHALPIRAQNVTVKGRDWLRAKGNFFAQEWEILDATVRVSGKRAYIFVAGSYEPVCWKPLQTIEIIQNHAGG